MEQQEENRMRLDEVSNQLYRIKLHLQSLIKTQNNEHQIACKSKNSSFSNRNEHHNLRKNDQQPIVHFPIKNAYPNQKSARKMNYTEQSDPMNQNTLNQDHFDTLLMNPSDSNFINKHSFPEIIKENASQIHEKRQVRAYPLFLRNTLQKGIQLIKNHKFKVPENGNSLIDQSKDGKTSISFDFKERVFEKNRKKLEEQTQNKVIIKQNPLNLNQSKSQRNKLEQHVFIPAKLSPKNAKYPQNFKKQFMNFDNKIKSTKPTKQPFFFKGHKKNKSSIQNDRQPAKYRQQMYKLKVIPSKAYTKQLKKQGKIIKRINSSMNTITSGKFLKSDNGHNSPDSKINKQHNQEISIKGESVIQHHDELQDEVSRLKNQILMLNETIQKKNDQILSCQKEIKGKNEEIIKLALELAKSRERSIEFQRKILTYSHSSQASSVIKFRAEETDDQINRLIRQHAEERHRLKMENEKMAEKIQEFNLRLFQKDCKIRQLTNELTNRKLIEEKQINTMSVKSQKHILQKQNELRSFKHALETMESKLQVAINQNRQKDEFIMSYLVKRNPSLTQEIKEDKNQQILDKYLKQCQYPKNKLLQKLLFQQKQLQRLRQILQSEGIQYSQ